MSGKQEAAWPIEPPPTSWQLPDPRRLPDQVAHGDLVGVGADLEPGTVLAAYRRGLFPMHVSGGLLADGDGGDDDPTGPETDVLGWWSPVNRGVLPLDALTVSRSLRRSVRRFDVTVNRAFGEVVERCGAPDRPGRWINDEINVAYQALHELGWAHSVEVWLDEALVGGLYGVAVGGLFAGESMFFGTSDASKVALVHLVEVMSEGGLPRLLDVQWLTEHLESLGAIEITRGHYLDQLEEALNLPIPGPFLNRD
jgi:leucyl/phenylalanyl-tRNA---protein transferase